MSQQVLGPYRLLRELGSGGMATVYLAESMSGSSAVPPGARVAVKILHPRLLEEENAAERFRQEAAAGARIDHQNVVRTLDVGREQGGQGRHYLVMEYVEGQSLRDLLDELGRVPEDLCRLIGREVSQALVAIHAEGIVHRDLKPENILITRDNVVKVMDLGVALLVDQRIRLSTTGQFVGSIYYAAPEQILGGGKHLDARVDLYQLGISLYELACGEHPFKAKNIRKAISELISNAPSRLSEANPQISAFFEEVVLRLVQKDPAERFQTAEELVEVFTHAERSRWWYERSSKIRTETRLPIRRAQAPRETALYGRDSEMASLDLAFEKARSGAGQAILISGEAGIGKTRLVEEFEDRVTVEGGICHFLHGSYRTGLATSAQGGFSRAYCDHFGANLLEDELSVHVSETPLLIPAFAALLRGEDPPEGAEPLTPASLQTVFAEVTISLSKDLPTVVLIEDLHLAHEEGVELFFHLAGAIAQHPVLLLGTARPDLAEARIKKFAKQRSARVITPSRLAADDLRRLLIDALGSERLARVLLNRIAVKSGGKPLYVFEILRGLREGQLIGKQADGTWVTTREIREIAVPSTVRDLVLSRIKDLDRVDRRVLEMASCCGFEFDPDLLSAALGIDSIALRKRLGVLERGHRLVRSEGSLYTFDDHPVQEALYGNLPVNARRKLHSSIARALERRESADTCDLVSLDGEVAVQLCRHFLRGNAPRPGARYFPVAADHLASGNLNGPAVRLMEQALAARGLLTGRRRVEVLLRQAGHLDLLGWRKEEAQALKTARGLADEIGIAGLRARASRQSGAHCRRTAEYGKAREYLTQAAHLARSADDPVEEAAATADLGSVAWREGRFEEARECYERAMALAARGGDRRAEALNRGNLGLVHLACGRHEEAGRAHRVFLEFARESGDYRNEALHTGYLADVLWAEGRYEQALEHYQRALEIARSIGDRLGEGTGYLRFGQLYPQLGRRESGLQNLEEARAVFKETACRVGEAAAVHGIGAVAEAEGRLKEAERLYEESLVSCREIGNRIGVAENLLDLGRLHGRMERPGAAMRELVEAQCIGRELDWPHTTVLAVGYLALIERGDVAYAGEMLDAEESRLSCHDRMEAHYILHQALGGDRHLLSAKSALDQLVANAPSDCREEMRREVPLHREILIASGD